MGSWTLFHSPRHRAFGSAPHFSGPLRRRASSKAALVARSPQLTGRVTGDVAVTASLGVLSFGF